ncbi:tape measure protein [Rufibacter sediminis]|uniref:Tape measure protein n=1 Tax=Rufibacter sediminis TaxID=2762756 RepID=A0ABR6VTY5_9BACT|nr:tape measure protein [Rufibacter sediminis]MBC3540661.1 tape measure protein [Rufibacter sediminis]
MLVRELIFKLGFNSTEADRKAKNFDRTVSGIKTGLVAMGKAALASAVVLTGVGSKIVDEYTALESRLGLVTNGMNELRTAQEGVYNIAQKTGTAYNAGADLFIRLTRSTRRFGYVQAQNLKVTEAIQKALVVSGDASSPGAQAALFQLGQGLQSGVLRGEELNSVLEQAPRLMEAILAGLNVAPEKMKGLAEKGFFTTQKIMDALLGQASEIDKEYAKLANRQAQSRMRLVNAFKKVIYQVSKEENAMDGLVDVYDALREIVESRDFKESFKTLITGLSEILKLVVWVIKHLTKLIRLINDTAKSMGGWERIIGVLGSALGAFALVKIGAMIAGFISLIRYLGLAFTASYALAELMPILRAAMLSLPIIAIAALLALLIEDLWNFYRGNESVVGKLVSKWDEFRRFFADVLTWPLKNLEDNLNKLIRLARKLGADLDYVDFAQGFHNAISGAANAGNFGGISYSGASMGRSINNSPVFNQQISLTVPPGTNKEQADYISGLITRKTKEAFQSEYRSALNNFPEVE